ncbi:type II toxin-antitoxin system VapC family toxin [Duganella levis]|uniref:PIN domain-containing protein n=1 Tax=Duganella levis TaxID=2692169 RepID=A0ABW9W6L8_9BURK|nr:type II toxin-antitoxin system VapC family toxin [Duganella levis]MYN29551.1 PIN domain-containing protein [Duganella levis]
MIVVDSNVIAYLFLSGEHTAAAERLLAEEPDWAAPVLWRSEFRNILAGHMRLRSLPYDQARQMQYAAETLLAGSEFELESASVLTLVRDSSCTAYDCEFVALAIMLGTKLVTMDQKLLRAFPKTIISLSSWSD